MHTQGIIKSVHSLIVIIEVLKVFQELLDFCLNNSNFKKLTEDLIAYLFNTSTALLKLLFGTRASVSYYFGHRLWAMKLSTHP